MLTTSWAALPAPMTSTSILSPLPRQVRRHVETATEFGERFQVALDDHRAMAKFAQPASKPRLPIESAVLIGAAVVVVQVQHQHPAGQAGDEVFPAKSESPGCHVEMPHVQQNAQVA